MKQLGLILLSTFLLTNAYSMGMRKPKQDNKQSSSKQSSQKKSKKTSKKSTQKSTKKITQKITKKKSTSKSDQYYYVDPDKLINEEALNRALAYYDKHYDSLRNKDYLSVIDFTYHSGDRRFFVIDMNSGEVEAHHTAHGSGGDRDHDGYVDQFSNVSRSHMSSLGLYRTAETYYSSKFKGTSLRLDGMSSTNSKARSRAIVIHPADYVKSHFSKMGRSWGCPALDHKYSDDIIRKIKGGSLIYAYHETLSK